MVIGVDTVGVIAVMGVVAGLTRARVPTDRVVDKGPAPPFRLPALNASRPPVELASHAGRPVVLNFWGSWCTPCRKELPLLAAAARAEAGRVIFLGVDLEDTRSAGQAMFSRYRVGYPSAFDPGDSLARPYLLGGTPTTIFIDSRGHVVGRVDGAVDPARLAWWLRRLT